MCVMKYLDLALPHVSQETREWFDDATPARTHCTGISVAPYEYGVFVSVPAEPGDIDDLECPKDLKAVLRYARRLDCHVVRLDQDGAIKADLPYYR